MKTNKKELMIVVIMSSFFCSLLLLVLSIFLHLMKTILCRKYISLGLFYKG